MNKKQLETKIADLKAGIESSSTDEKYKPQLRELLKQAESELAALSKAETPAEKKTVEKKAETTVEKAKKLVSKVGAEPKKAAGGVKKSAQQLIDDCRKLLSRNKQDKKVAAKRIEKRKKAGKPAELTPSETVSKTAKAVSSKVISIKEKSDKGLPVGEINKLSSGIIATIRATIKGIVSTGDKRVFLDDLVDEINSLKSGLPKAAEFGGNVDFNSGAGMFEKGGGVGMKLLVDNFRGIYVPLSFAKGYDLKQFGFSDEKIKELKSDLSSPENEFYWEAWEDVLDNAVTKDGETLFQHDGNLWLVPANFDPEADGGSFARGGKTASEKGGMAEYFAKKKDETFEIEDENAEMLYSQVKEIKHHAEEILSLMCAKTKVESWVVAKGERSSTDLSDIYHYLDGRKEMFCCGGSLEDGGELDGAGMFATGGSVEGLYEKLIKEYEKGGWGKISSFDRFLEAKKESALEKGDSELYNKLFDIQYMYENDFYAKGGNLRRDRMFISQQEWEKDYKRKTAGKRYKHEQGGAIVDYTDGTLADPRFDINSPVFENGGSVSKYTDFYLVVNLDERGLYSATVYDPEDKPVFEIESAEMMAELIEDGFMKYKADEDLNRLTKHLMNLNIIPNFSQVYSEDEFEQKIRDQYAEGGKTDTPKFYKINNATGVEDVVDKFLLSLNLKEYSKSMGDFQASLTLPQLKKLKNLLVENDKNGNVYILDGANNVIFDTKQSVRWWNIEQKEGRRNYENINSPFLVGDLVEVVYVDDHNAEKYKIGDRFEVKNIQDVGSDNSLYFSEYTNYPFHPDHLRLITKTEYKRGGGLSRDRMFVSQQEWEKDYKRKTAGKRYKFAKGGSVLGEDTVGRVDDPNFSDASKY